MNIILIGFKSCGKSTIGRALARQLARTFVDTDTLIEDLHTQTAQEQLSCREICRQYGEPYFRTLEQQMIPQLRRYDQAVIAVGGGTFVNHPIPPDIRGNATVFYLDTAPDLLLTRIRDGGVPSFFNTDDVEQAFNALLQVRTPIYRVLADYTIPVRTADPQEAINQILICLASSDAPFSRA
jgi:shikimate kinase